MLQRVAATVAWTLDLSVRLLLLLIVTLQVREQDMMALCSHVLNCRCRYVVPTLLPGMNAVAEAAAYTQIRAEYFFG